MLNKNFLTLFLASSFVLSAYSQSENERKIISSSYDIKKLNFLKEEYHSLYTKRKTEADKFARENGLAIRFIDKDGNLNELQYIENGIPIYYKTYNAGSSQTIRANSLNTGGDLGLDLNGQGMTIGIWDGGLVLTTHEALVGRTTIKDGTSSLSFHSTHVLGTMIGSGEFNSTAKGMAPEAHGWVNDWGNDQSEAATQAAQGLLVSNHSYGPSVISDNGVPIVDASFFGTYNATSQAWDDIMYNAPMYQVVWAAGNDRDSYGVLNPTKNGSDLLASASVSKNVFVVGAVSQVDNYTGPSSVQMSDFSNWGPTNDTRIKPDIVAKGVGVVSTSSSGDSDYEVAQGTSMAAPAVSGAMLLLQQHFNNLKGKFMRSATLRALVIHTADEAGDAIGPDHKFGWGLMNTKAAAQAISNTSSQSSGGSLIRELTLSQGGVYTENITSDGVNPLVVTIAWTDPAGTPTTGDDATARLVNNLDLVVKKGATSNFPWALLSNINTAVKMPNDKDNVEKVEILVPTGEYQIVVNHKNNLLSGSQDFSLIVTGINNTLNVDSQTFNNNINIYPNPTTDLLNFDITGNILLDKVEIYDTIGKRVLSSQINNNSVDVSELTAGVYFVKIYSGENQTTKKIIKK